jgi:RimJ/RimL family protein N-acetyltransferase
MPVERVRIEWSSQGEVLAAVEPTPAEVAAGAGELAAAYNDAHNRVMMAHTAEMSAAEVVAHYASMAQAGARPFLLLRDGALAGDADLRHIAGGRAEFAILVAARAAQGRGLGTRFALMLHAFAFRALGLQRVYVTIVPGNAASRRLFEKLGYQPDDTPGARAYADDETDVSLSIARADFERAHPLPDVQITARTGP